LFESFFDVIELALMPLLQAEAVTDNTVAAKITAVAKNFITFSFAHVGGCDLIDRVPYTELLSEGRAKEKPLSHLEKRGRSGV
jgi:hypothetical protein